MSEPKDSPNFAALPGQNKQAWDTLYRDTEGRVWGSEPIPWVVDFLKEIGSQLPEDARVLDAAAGAGRHFPLLLGLPGTASACDSSENALETLGKIEGDFDLMHCDLESIPVEAETFDFVLLIDTIETLPNVEEILAELRRILKPGGRLLCNIPGKDDGISGEEMEPTVQEAEEAYLYQGKYFFRFYEEDSALELVRESGFSVVKNEVHTWWEDPHPGFRPDRHSHTSRVFLLQKPEEDSHE